MKHLLGSIEESEKQIDELRKTFEAESASIKHATLMSAQEIFNQLGWTNWNSEVFFADGQYERLVKAYRDKKMFISSISSDKKEGSVMGSSEHTVSSNRCTCNDFLFRGLPCKHMFFFVLNGDNPEAIRTAPVTANAENKTADSVPTVVIAGDFGDVSRDEIAEAIENMGWRYSGSVSSNTSYLICGDNAGTKKEKAIALNVPIISLDDFYKMLK